ncbi:DUF371 domain-containing protein [Fervidicoccus fontis]|uniref:DUF371 domain-containing protein n=1 Tax=Fervidicoccus fontis TaxID=683846 RepID=A0A2J6N3W0_9CREN|nr:DUF371 domain-containing protein [Fervidicoccus fontis]MBE9390947.1 DUF371 domain-containing protein [Fervidicoccus fontis]PMB76022.1 MAG: DUF371 domain-containing protein [Fervidicoccus fontis]HEW64306.1 DUF371 domain-containing protein [Fervidicoccus fontis]
MREIKLIVAASDWIVAYGHYNVLATHRTTFEITKDNYLTKRGNCIIGIKSSKSLKDLSEDMKNNLRNSNTIVRLILYVDGKSDAVTCMGNENLILNSDSKIIVRKSGYIDGSTLCINADKSSNELSREVVKKLREGKKVTLGLIVYSLSLH